MFFFQRRWQSDQMWCLKHILIHTHWHTSTDLSKTTTLENYLTTTQCQIFIESHRIFTIHIILTISTIPIIPTIHKKLVLYKGNHVKNKNRRLSPMPLHSGIILYQKKIWDYTNDRSRWIFVFVIFFQSGYLYVVLRFWSQLSKTPDSESYS